MIGQLLKGRTTATATLTLAACLCASTAWAQPASGDVTEKLIQILVKNGVLTQPQAKDLLDQARAEARARPTVAPAAAASTATDKPAPQGTVRVTYVPESVRKQIAAEVKQQVLQQAQDQGWAEPSVIPGWTQRVRVYGDVRMRGQWDNFPSNNYNLFPDFNGINGSSNGYDTNSASLPPLLNTTQGRMRTRLRARLGVEAQITDWAVANIRIATGSDSSPVSTNQTLGATGDFSKYAIWLDTAYIQMKPVSYTTISVGRMPNPFWTTDLLYDDDLNFDGFAVANKFGHSDGVQGFVTLGGFPVFNTAFNLGSTNAAKTSSQDGWLVAVQGGAEWRFQEEWKAKIGMGFFGYNNIEGRKSQLCVGPTSFGSCSTDTTRAPFIQFGNTVFPVRNISTAGSSTTAQPQFYGLASKFQELDIHAQMSYYGFHPVDVVVDADYVMNMAFDRRKTASKSPVNNIGANNAFVGGDTGWTLKLTVGRPELKTAWDWNVSVAYKYIESDAVLDALTDSKFHLGGTNAQGFVLGGNLAFARDLWMSARWYSTNAISGPPYSVDSIMIDLNAKF